MFTIFPKLPVSSRLAKWAPLGSQHCAELFGLLSDMEALDNVLFRTSLEEVNLMLRKLETCLAVGAFALVPSDNTFHETSGTKKNGERKKVSHKPGDLIAFGYVGLAQSGKKEVICHGGVHPKYRGLGLGKSLIDWQTGVGQNLLSQVFPSQDGQIVHTVYSKRRVPQNYLTQLGYGWEESHVELRHDLEQIPRIPALPAYVEVVPWEKQWEQPTLRAFKRASLNVHESVVDCDAHWGGSQDSSGKRWSYLALDKSGDRTLVVGVLKLGSYKQDWGTLVWEEGYIDTVAIFEHEQRDTVLQALVSHGMGALAEAGLDKIAVGLDPDREPKMMELYLDLGFRSHVFWRTYTYNIFGK